MSLDMSDVNAVSGGVPDDDIIQPPGDITNTGAPVTVVPQTSMVKAQQTPLIGDSLAKLPDMDVQFKIITDNAIKVVDLKSVENEISQEGHMSKSLANYANESFDRTLFQNVPENHFTDLPTQTNRVYVINFMQRKIAAEETQLQEEFSKFVPEAIEDMGDILEKIEKHYTVMLEGQLIVTSERFLSLRENILENKNTIIPTETGFINLSTADINILDLSKLDKLGEKKAHYTAVIEGLREVLKCPDVRTFVNSIDAGLSGLAIFEIQNRADHQEAAVSISKLFNAFTSPEVRDLFDDLIARATDQYEKVKDIQETLEETTVLHDHIAENAAEYSKLIHYTTQLTSLIGNIELLARGSTDLIQIFKEF